VLTQQWRELPASGYMPYGSVPVFDPDDLLRDVRLDSIHNPVCFSRPGTYRVDLPERRVVQFVRLDQIPLRERNETPFLFPRSVLLALGEKQGVQHVVVLAVDRELVCTCPLAFYWSAPAITLTQSASTPNPWTYVPAMYFVQGRLLKRSPETAKAA